ncbi:MAG TPA: hypothetical protein PKW95_21255 [bacterium]|nr:hypothetical protein [bacterium]
MRIATLVMVLALLLAFGAVAFAQDADDDSTVDDDEDALDDDDATDDDDSDDDDDDDEDDNEEQSDGEEEMTSEEREENGDGLARAHDDDNDLGGCGY